MTPGSCFCGDVRYQAAGFSSIYKCHCSKCRKVFGAAASAASMIPADQFSWQRGADKISCFESESGFRRFFCRRCGSVLPQYVADFDLWWIPVGSLDEDPGVPLTTHIHVDSMPAWDVIADDLTKLPGGFTD